MNNDIKEVYCSFEVSKLLKEKGFGVKCLYCYLEDGSIQMSSGDEEDKEEYNHNLWDNYSRPTHALAINWIRENFGIDISSHCDIGGRNYYCYTLTKVKQMPFYEIESNKSNFKSPEEATEAALLYTLKNLI